MRSFRAGMVALIVVAAGFATGCASKPDTQITTADETTKPVPELTPPPTTYAPETVEPPPTFALPPGKVPCMILYGTLLPGDEKDVPVYRTDGGTPEQIATIHLPDEVWTPAEAKDLCA